MSSIGVWGVASGLAGSLLDECQCYVGVAYVGIPACIYVSFMCVCVFVGSGSLGRVA